MNGEASIWQPRTIIEVSGDTKSIEEKIVALAGQAVFVLSTFAYAVGTGALEVHRNGLLLVKNTDWVEQTATSFQLVVATAVGDVIVATGHVGITGDVDVRDTDIFVLNYQAIRDYSGTEITLYAQGKVTRGDTGEAFFQEIVGQAVGFFVDNDKDVIVPTGGDGSRGWIRNVPNELFVTYGDFGADPTGAVDSAAAIQDAINFASTNQVELRGEAGTFKVLSRLLIPKQKGFIWTMQRDCILDSSSATTAFFTVDAYSDRAAGVSSDFTEGLHISGGMIKPSPIAGSYGMALFYVLNACSIRNVEIREGDGGLLITKSFYGFYENIKIKDCANIGLSLLSGGTGDTGINANFYKALFIIGCKNNLFFDDVAGSFSNVATFDSCAFERSAETSVIINSVRPVKFLGCYWENNYTSIAAAGEVVELDCLDASVVLDSCFMNTSNAHDAGAFSVSGDTTVRVIDLNTFKAKGTITDFYNPAILHVDFYDDGPNSDLSNAGSGYARRLNAGAATKRMIPHIDATTADRTIAPISGVKNGASSTAVTDLVEIDITTAQLRSGWSFVFQAVSYESNTVNETRRGLAVLLHISAFKDGAEFNVSTTVVSQQLRLSSNSGIYNVVSDGVSKITINWDGQSAGLPHTQDIQWQVRDFVCRSNGDIVGINRL